MKKELVKYAFGSALGEAAYIMLVALFMFSIQKMFGAKPDPGIIAPIVFLLLFVISASISGALILGKPAALYLDGQKKDAVNLFGLTLGWLALFLIIALFIMAKLTF